MYLFGNTWLDDQYVSLQGPDVPVFEPPMDEHKRIAWDCTAQGCH